VLFRRRVPIVNELQSRRRFHFHLFSAAAENNTEELQKRGNESVREQISSTQRSVLTTDQAMRRKAE
jgi:hypothetical protein